VLVSFEVAAGEGETAPPAVIWLYHGFAVNVPETCTGSA
jgi:hypothetical protein